MTSDRPYRRARAAASAAEEVDRCAGTQFDPEIAQAFLGAWDSGAFGPTRPRASASAPAATL
jgi:HD-GYP domain-containing protein (c-di-GMP phosphodiesterase class II)